jgi:UDPglucose 6-dehydrogenase
MRICVIGAGYVGLVTAAVFADMGNQITCLDTDPEKIADLCAGRAPFYEPGLEEMIARNGDAGRLCFTADYGQAVPGCEMVFIAVGTPPGPDGAADLSHLESAAAQAARHLADGALIVVKSTVPVGSGDRVRDMIERNLPSGVRFELASNPEFLREGSAIADCLRPDRIVIGCENQGAAMRLVQLYAPLERPMLLMDMKSAELVKQASNAFLATRLSFINTIADLCEATGADIAQVIKGMGADARIGSHFLSPGIGYGGSCLPKDTSALAACCQVAGCSEELMSAVIAVNSDRVQRFVGRIRRMLGELRGRTIAVLGLAFKPNTDDLRESKAVELVKLLLAEGARVRVYDPAAMAKARPLLPEVSYCEDAYDAAAGADALAIATDWNEFRMLDLERIRAALSQPIIFDGRNLYSPDFVSKRGFRYVSIGRPDTP